MSFDLAKILIVVIGLGLIPMSAVPTVASAESKVCSDGTPCPSESEPSDEELEDYCSDEAETI